jgi:hypothetical protein
VDLVHGLFKAGGLVVGIGLTARIWWPSVFQSQAFRGFAMPDHAYIRTSKRSTPAHAPEPGFEDLLDGIEYRFRLSGQGPQPLSVDGRQLGHGLPARLIALPELSSVLMHPSCGEAAKDAVWRLLVENARTGRKAWVVGAVGVALPGLRSRAYLLWLHSRGDVQAALVTEFVTALSTLDLTADKVIKRLLSAAFSQARMRLRAAEPAGSGEANFAPGSVLPPPPFGHPDFVLARAVRRGVLTGREADMIGAICLDLSFAHGFDRRVS